MSNPKNIIIFSDGTGNSGAKLRGTNVWRLFEAIEGEPAQLKSHCSTCTKVSPSTPDCLAWKQIALYDDGVGTSEFKPLKIIGGAFGWGITANLERMYRFLAKHYQPGDRIYLFGFSRGAFTVRTLSNILWYCGLPGGEGMTPDDLSACSKAAIEAYKRRVQGDRELGQPKALREEFVSKKKGYGNVPVWFIGVWDTVDAVGLPFDEMTDAFSWLMPLRLGESMHEGEQIHEDDLHPLVEHAYQAMAIDDRRYTFHPLLFQDRFPAGSDNAGKLKPIAHGTNPRIRQVWFAGMHSNVGGGYPQDSLSLVSLQWMLKRIEQAAPLCERLRFTNLVDDYQRDADPLGRIYDSRTGTGVFYRYRPRSIEKLHKIYELTGKPRIHWSVLHRISERVDNYGPAMIPSDYEIELPEQLAYSPAGLKLPEVIKESACKKRHNAQKPAEDHMMVGRMQYWLFVIFFLVMIFTAWRGPYDWWASLPIPGFVGGVEAKLLEIVSAVLPSYLGFATKTFGAMPGSVTIAMAILLFLWNWSGVIVSGIRLETWNAWNLSFPPRDKATVKQSSAPTFKQDMKDGFLRRMIRNSALGTVSGRSTRGLGRYTACFFNIWPKLLHKIVLFLVRTIGAQRLDSFIDWFNWRIAPKIVLLAGVAALLALAKHYF